MLAAGLIVFREVLEAALICGIVLATTKGVVGSRKWVAGGVLAGLAGAAVLALFAGTLATSLSGSGQEIFNAAVMAVAVVMLGWHNVWMSRHGRAMAQEMRGVGRAVSEGSEPLSILATVVGVAVLREGSETILFLYGILASEPTGLMATIMGALGGLALGTGFGVVLYAGLVNIPARHLFGVTSWLVTLLAAGMAAQSVSFLAAAGVIDSLGETVWDSSWLLEDKSLMGRVMHTLVGYTDQPSQIQLLAYVVTVAVIVGLGRLLGTQPKKVAHAAA
ncbi:MAG: FTR1 family protein [Alphaproteobacteria bacterium]